MRVGFDAKKAVKNLTGIGNYSRRCINSLARYHGDETQLFLFAPKSIKKAAIGELKGDYSLIAPKAKGLFGELWRNFLQWRSVRRNGIDVYHGLSNELPFGIGWSRCKKVVTIHDLIFLRYPETYSREARLILGLKTRYACRKADHIVAVSYQTARDIIGYYGVYPDKVSVIYQSFDASRYQQKLSAEAIADACSRYALPEKYVLCVGTIEQRKNQLTVAKALEYLPEDVHVVLVGKKTVYQNDIECYASEAGLAHRLHIINGVPNDDLPAIYQAASVFAYMSIFEGFGIPILEALASRLPVIAATGSCLEEAGGTGSIYLPPYNVKELANTITELLQSPDKVDEMCKVGEKHLANFSDENLANELLNLYKNI